MPICIQESEMAGTEAGPTNRWVVVVFGCKFAERGAWERQSFSHGRIVTGVPTGRIAYSSSISESHKAMHPLVQLCGLG